MNMLDNIKYEFYTDKIHIEDSYIISSRVEMQKILEHIINAASNEGIHYSRSIRSWIAEWRAHNLLYILGYKRSHTISVDLNEDESMLRLIAYKVCSCLYYFFE